VYERDALESGQIVAGPAVIQEASSTLVLPAGSRAKMDASGNIVVELAAATTRSHDKAREGVS
jgi:N-methylhydantoinase A